MTMPVRPCTVSDVPGHWPLCHVRAVTHPPGVSREAARQQVRALLAAEAGESWAARLRRSSREVPAPGPVSISHEGERSLLAWCDRGGLGIDLVDVAALQDTAESDVLATAALYLGPAWQDDAMAGLDGTDPRLHFAHAWARHEASLKCLGLGLTEWVAHGPAVLASCEQRPVILPPLSAGPGPVRWVAWLAWRPAAC